MDLKNKRILITGGAGYIGSVLAPKLLTKGCFVRIFDGLILGQDPPLPQLRLEFIKGDLRNEKDLSQTLKDVDLIVHLAALVGEPACAKNPNLAFEINEKGTEILNKLRGSLPLIFFSTSSVYGETKDKVCFEEKTNPEPILPYAKSKLKAEKIIKDSQNFIILRPATAFGASPKMRLDLLINQFVFSALKIGFLKLYNPDFKRTFIHIKDLTEAVLIMAQRFEELKEQIFNVGSNEMNASKKEIVELIRSKINFKIKIVPGDIDPDKRNFVVNYDKIKKTGFETKISLERGIARLIEHCQGLKESPSFYNINYQI